jgi:hypothetical protein
MNQNIHCVTKDSEEDVLLLLMQKIFYCMNRVKDQLFVKNKIPPAPAIPVISFLFEKFINFFYFNGCVYLHL